MHYIVVKEVNRDDDLHAVVEQEAALDQLGPRKLLFINRVSALRSPSLMNISGSIIYLQSLERKRKAESGKRTNKHSQT